MTRDGDGKIFCIGLPRTGTTTFRVTCKMFGLRVAGDPLGADLLKSLAETGRIPDDCYDMADVFADVAISTWWVELAKNYPRARFVLTTRRPFDWAESMNAVFGSKSLRIPGRRVDRAAGEVACWMGWRKPTSGVEPYLAIRHVQEVDAQFSPCPVLRVNVFDRSSPADLLPFLGIYRTHATKVPDEWPHANPRSECV